jgi:hypothetical protein
MIVAELFILPESISVECTPQYSYLLDEYSRGIGVVVDQLGACHTMGSIVLSLWVQRPLFFVPFSALPEPISPNISLTTTPASDWSEIRK